MSPGGAGMIGLQGLCLHRWHCLWPFRSEYDSGRLAPAEGARLGPDDGKPVNLLRFLRYGLYTHSAVQYGS